MIASDLRSGSDWRSLSLILTPIPNPSWSEPNNFSFNSLHSFRLPIWTYSYPFLNLKKTENTYSWTLNLGDDAVQNVDKYKVKHGRWCCVETDFQQIIVVRGDTETRHETVHHQIHVLTHTVLTARERLRCVEQQRLVYTHKKGKAIDLYSAYAKGRRSSHLKCTLVINRSRRPPRPPLTACTHRLGQRSDRWPGSASHQ